ncbi:MAG: hypothetical protein K7J46_17230 [Bryobacter sp.]|nr:hypothetical protein [Bryobacter sp. CoA8 C33]
MWQKEEHFVAEGDAENGISDTRVSAGGIENDVRFRQGPRTLTIKDHVRAGAVLDEAARVEALSFGENLDARVKGRKRGEAQQRGDSNVIEP